jgi:tetrahydromethanopterin S-methyltransferase subunit C
MKAMRLSGKRREYTSLVVAQAYFLSKVGADVAYARPFGLSYLLNSVFAAAATVLWTAALIRRLARCGLSRWWVLGYVMLLLAGGVTAALRKLNDPEIAVAVIAWVALQLPLMLLRDKPEDLAD